MTFDQKALTFGKRESIILCLTKTTNIMVTIKQEEIQKILGIMQNHGITVADIKDALENARRPKNPRAFDLLIEVNGAKMRVSFDEGKDKNPIAIFPRSDLNSFLYLDETQETTCPAKLDDRRSLLTENFSGLLWDVRPELNARLRQLGKPELTGDYWGYAHEYSGCGYYMARFDFKKHLEFTYYDAKHRAKIRRMGRI